MRRRVSTLPLLLLLAAMASPALGSSRSVESLRVVVTIAWLHDQDAPQSAPVDQTPRRLSGAASPSLVLRALDSRARSTALLRARFQRPPPRLLAL